MKINDIITEAGMNRRGFLKGMVATAGAATLGSLPKGADAQEVDLVRLTNYAAQKASEIVTSYPSVMTAQRRSYFANYISEEVYKQTQWYLNVTGGYNAGPNINGALSIAKSECDNLKTGVGDFVGGAGLRDNLAIKIVNTFIQTYTSVLRQKANSLKQDQGQQQQQQKSMGGLSREEFSTLADGLTIYAILKDVGMEKTPMFTEISGALNNVIKSYNNKDYVNSTYSQVKQSVDQVKSTPGAYEKEVARVIDPKLIISTVDKLNKMASMKKPEFESLEETSPEAIAKINQITRK